MSASTKEYAPQQNALRLEARKRMADRRNKVVEMHLAGRTRNEIAAEVGIAAEFVSNICSRYWRALRIKKHRNGEDYRQRLIAQHELAIREAFAAWERSKEVQEVQTVEKRADSEAHLQRGRAKTVVKKVKRGRDGNPAFLQQAERHMSEIAKLMNLYPAEKLELTGANGGPVDLRVDEQRLLPVQRMVERELKAGTSPADARAHLLQLGVQNDDLDVVFGLLAAADNPTERD